MNTQSNRLSKKKIINITLITLGVFALIALIILLFTWRPKQHTHTFNDTYSNNETHHWFSASCEHKELMEGYSEHIFDDLMMCTACQYQSSIDPEKPMDTTKDINFTYNNTTILLTANDQETIITVSDNCVTVSTEVLEQSIYFYEDYYELIFHNASGYHTVRVDSVLTPLGYVHAQYPEIASLSDALNGLSSKMAYDESTNVATLSESNTLSLPLTVHYPSISGSLTFDNEKVVFLDINFTIYIAGEKTKGNVKVTWDNSIPLTPAPEASTGLTYEFVTSGKYAGTYTITGMTQELRNVIIPSEIGGITVSNIADRAFRNTDIESVVIPGSVKVIGKSAFENCSKLVLIQLEDGVEVISTRAFARINPDYTIYMHDSITEFGKDAFLYNSNYKSNGAWYYSGDINKYAMSTFGDSNATPAATHTTYFNKEEVLAVHLLTAEYISDYAFRDFSEVIEYRFGTSVKYIGTLAIDGISSTGYGSTKKDAPYTIMYEGTLDDWLKIEFKEWWALGYGYDLYCNNNKMIFANIQNISTVPEYAFAFCRSLSSIELGPSVTTIKKGAFQYCNIISFEATSNLKIVEKTAFMIDEMHTSMEASAFTDYKGAYYIGTHDNPYYICFEIYDPDNFVLVMDCVITVN